MFRSTGELGDVQKFPKHRVEWGYILNCVNPGCLFCWSTVCGESGDGIQKPLMFHVNEQSELCQKILANDWFGCVCDDKSPAETASKLEVQF